MSLKALSFNKKIGAIHHYSAGPSEAGRQGRPHILCQIFFIRPLSFEPAYFCPSQRDGSEIEHAATDRDP